jgi:hypothetical protein
MAYKLLKSAQQRWRRFNGHGLVADGLAGAKFSDGIKVTDDDNKDDGITARGSPPDRSDCRSTGIHVCAAPQGRRGGLRNL